MCPIQYLCIQYAKPWPHCDIRTCCHRCLHAFTFRYDSTLLGHIIFTLKVFLHEMCIPYMYYKLFKVEKFCGCKTKLQFTGKHLWLDGSFICPKPIAQDISLENFLVTDRSAKTAKLFNLE